MKVGDLVQLSAYGRNRDYNHSLSNRVHRVGLVMQVFSQYNYSYRVKWCGVEPLLAGAQFHSHMRKELKHAKLA